MVYFLLSTSYVEHPHWGKLCFPHGSCPPEIWPVYTACLHPLLPSFPFPAARVDGERSIFRTVSEMTELINEWLCLPPKVRFIVVLWPSIQPFMDWKVKHSLELSFMCLLWYSSHIFYVCCCYIVAIIINLRLVYLLWTYNGFTSWK